MNLSAQATVSGSRETTVPDGVPSVLSPIFARQKIVFFPSMSANAPGKGLLTPRIKLKTSRAVFEKSMRPS